MAKETFLKLPGEKKNKIVLAFLREFTRKSFDEASISTVVKELGIAKGSIYQYFNDKLDLFLFLVQECNEVKAKYLLGINRDDYVDFWTYYKQLIEGGVKFDLENPIHSLFLHHLPVNLQSKSTRPLYNDFLNQILTGFEQMVKVEINNGSFSNDVPSKTLAYFFYKISLAINEQFSLQAGNDINVHLSSETSMYQDRLDEFMEIVEDYIFLLKKAIASTEK